MNDNREGDDSSAADLTGPTVDDQLPPPGILELDHVYRALAHPRRRYLCYTLLEEASWSLPDLATKVAAWENEVSEDAVTESQRRRVLVSLYHAHVPKLVDDEIIYFDEATETIRPAGNAAQVLSVLEAMGGGAPTAGRRRTHGVRAMTFGADGGVGSDEPAPTDEPRWRQVAQRLYEPDGDEELTTAIVFAVADAAGVSPTEVRSPPLYEVVDAAAIEDVFFGSGRETRGTGTVEFRYQGYRVEIRSDGWIVIFEPDEPEEA